MKANAQKKVSITVAADAAASESLLSGECSRGALQPGRTIVLEIARNFQTLIPRAKLLPLKVRESQSGGLAFEGGGTAKEAKDTKTD